MASHRRHSSPAASAARGESPYDGGDAAVAPCQLLVAQPHQGMERLRRVAPLGAAPPPAASPAAADLESPPPSSVADAPAKLLSDDQVKSYIQNGYVALPVTDMPPEWHDGLWQKCHDWLFERGEIEPQQDSRWVFPSIPELSDVILSPTVRGALESILGPGYVQHPHRTMHNYGPSMHNQQEIGSDQTWHKVSEPLSVSCCRHPPSLTYRVSSLPAWRSGSCLSTGRPSRPNAIAPPTLGDHLLLS